MNDFFNKEIKRNDAKEVLQTLNRLFKDIKNSKLKRYFIEILSKHVLYLTYFLLLKNYLILQIYFAHSKWWFTLKDNKI